MRKKAFLFLLFISSLLFSFNINCNSTQVKLDPTPTKLTLECPSKPIILGEKIKITAILTDEGGKPIEGETVDFYIFFIGKIGSSKTNMEGKALIEYLPNKTGVYEVYAKYEGSTLYMKSRSPIKEFIVKEKGEVNPLLPTPIVWPKEVKTAVKLYIYSIPLLIIGLLFYFHPVIKRRR